MSEAKDSSGYLGICVAERVLSNFFDGIHRMPANNRGYDFICKNGFKIDVKSSCLRHWKNGTPLWFFSIRKNKIANYFICLAFDDRESLEPQHVWLLPANKVSHLESLGIRQNAVSQWKEYEKGLARITDCCAKIRSTGGSL